MEQNPKPNPRRGLKASPPLGAAYESPPNLLDQMRQLNVQDPAFASWVLVCAQNIVSLAEIATRDGKPELDLKGYVSQKLIEAYDMHLAHIKQIELMELLSR
ncbi:MAG TPA: hypothetical protein VNG90_01995 [Candidatus Acidoferrum sp.]|nr:hypothetical protein [Candidatus Acidoferrum sp.]